MRRASKKEAKDDGGGGSGRGGAKRDQRPPAKWTPVSLEEEFPEEFRYTALLASALFVVILSLYAATMHPSVSGARLGSHGAAAPPPRAPHPAPRAPRPCATHRVALRIAAS
jgi:hypothetical protein